MVAVHNFTYQAGYVILPGGADKQRNNASFMEETLRKM